MNNRSHRLPIHPSPFSLHPPHFPPPPPCPAPPPWHGTALSPRHAGEHRRCSHVPEGPRDRSTATPRSGTDHGALPPAVLPLHEFAPPAASRSPCTSPAG